MLVGLFGSGPTGKTLVSQILLEEFSFERAEDVEGSVGLAVREHVWNPGRRLVVTATNGNDKDAAFLRAAGGKAMFLHRSPYTRLPDTHKYDAVIDNSHSLEQLRAVVRAVFLEWVREY